MSCSLITSSLLPGFGCEKNRFVTSSIREFGRFQEPGLRNLPTAPSKHHRASWLLLWIWASPVSLWISKEWFATRVPAFIRWVQQALDLGYSGEDCSWNSSSCWVSRTTYSAEINWSPPVGYWWPSSPCFRNQGHTLHFSTITFKSFQELKFFELFLSTA